MTVEDVLEWLEGHRSEEHRAGLLRFGIPNDRALGISMADLKKHARTVGRDHDLAMALWETGIYEARTLAAFVDEPDRVEPAQMDSWVADFDSWAICDTVCFHLFDRTAHAWEKAEEWTGRTPEFERRAGYAVFWGLSVHDKKAPDASFEHALRIIAGAEADERLYVKKAINMTLRAIGKRNASLNRAALEVADALASAADPHRSWIGRHARKELSSEKVQARFG